MRLIDADWAERKAKEIIDGYAWAIRMAVGNAPTVDAVPVKHGRWELVDEAEPRRYGCSKCSCLSWYGTYKYCPNCGARMDGETDDHG